MQARCHHRLIDIGQLQYLGSQITTEVIDIGSI